MLKGISYLKTINASLVYLMPRREKYKKDKAQDQAIVAQLKALEYAIKVQIRALWEARKQTLK
jgi:hypothetical protein